MSSSDPDVLFEGNQDKSYALSGKIMLSAIVVLFFVVILMVCLHLYARWYLLRSRHRNPRRSSRRNHIVFHLDGNRQQQPSSGLEAAVLRSLPVFVFAGGDSPIECAVCLSEFEEKESGRRLTNCGHSFHTECIDMWFHSHSTCPLCRSPVEPIHLLPISSPSPSPLSTAADSEVRIDIAAAESRSESEYCPDCGEEGSSSVEARRKNPIGVSIVVPARNAGDLGLESPASIPTPTSAFRSPMSRMLSFTRILSRERRNSGVSPSSAMATEDCSGSAANELDAERGKESTR